MMSLVRLGYVLAALAVSVGGASARGGGPPGRIAVATSDGRIVLIDPAGNRLAALTKRAPSKSDEAPAWSPDGTRIAFVRTTDGRRSLHVYVMRADGTGIRQITRGRFDDSPAWSPDGRWIAYSSESGLRLVHPDGTASRAVRDTGSQKPNCAESFASTPSWAPGGRLSFAFHAEIPSEWPTSCRSAGAHCGWVLTTRPDGRDRRPVVRGRDAHWSPDGTSIVYTRPDGGVATISSGGGSARFLGRGYLADWSADGARIVFARLGQNAHGDSIWVMNADGSGRHLIMREASGPAWQPD